MPDPIKPEDVGETTIPDVVAPPPPGSNLGEVVRYYTETAQRLVPGWDVELIPLSGKNPRVNGDGWQTLASSDAMTVLEQVKAAGRGVNGFGALMNKHIAFDVDHPEFLPPALASIFEEGLANHSRPGRTHYIFRVPDGMRFGGSPTKLNEAFGVLGKWGEIKAWNGQIRVWSPNPDDGTHVALQPGPIPPLSPVLIGLLSSPLGDGEMVSIAELDDWLDDHVETRHMSYLGGDIAKLRTKAVTSSKYEAMNSTVFHLSCNVASGAYPGREAYDALLAAYKELCESDDDWDGQRLGKYQDSWRGAAAKQARDPDLIEQARERRGMYSVGTVTFDPENDETDAMLLGLMDNLAIHEGRRVSWDAGGDLGRDVDEARIAALAAAPYAAEETAEVPTSRSELVSDARDTSDHEASSAAENATEDLDDEFNYVPHYSEPVDEPVTDLDAYKSKLLEQSRGEIGQRLKDLAISEIARTEYRKLRTGALDIDWIPLDLENIEPETPPKFMPVKGAYPEAGTVDAASAGDLLGLMYDDGLMNLIGDKGCGKSWMMVAEAARYLSVGGHVAWLDWEMTPSRMSRRLVNVGCHPSHMNRFMYMQMAGTSFEEVRGKLARLPGGTMIVIDSVARALASEGGFGDGADENSASFYNSWFERVAGLRSYGMCLGLIEHTGHTNQHRGRGSSAKGQAVDSEVSVHVVEPWSRADSGWAGLVVRKDRGGFHLADEPEYGTFFTPIGDGDLGIETRKLNDWERSLAKIAMMNEGDRAKFEKDAAVGARGKELEDAVVAALADGTRRSAVDIAKICGVSRTTIKPVLDGLAASRQIKHAGPAKGPGSGYERAF